MPTQIELAAKVKVSQSMISFILAGKRRPSWKKAKKIAEATGTNPVLWLEGSPEEMKAALSNNGGGKTPNQG